MPYWACYTPTINIIVFKGFSALGFQNHKERVPQIGEVYLMKFGGSGSEQSGWRPGVVFQNNMGNAYSPNIIALPLTSSLKKTNQPTHVIIKAADSGLRRDSMVLCENPERMSKEPRAVHHYVVRGAHEASCRSKLAGDGCNRLSGHRSAACCVEESRSPKRCCTSIMLHTK